MNSNNDFASDDADRQNRVRMLECLVRRYAWCRVPSLWFYSDSPDYLLVVELLDGRRFWRCLADSSRTPDEIMLSWAGCTPQTWLRQFHAGGKGSQHWNEFFDFWTKLTRANCSG